MEKFGFPIALVEQRLVVLKSNLLTEGFGSQPRCRIAPPLVDALCTGAITSAFSLVRRSASEPARFFVHHPFHSVELVPWRNCR